MLVSVAGVLLGIAFAAMLFILQSGFSSFKYSRRMFVLLYLYFGKQILFSLAYLTAMPFLIIYLPESIKIISLFQLLFCYVFIRATLDYAKEEGYITTLHSNKFVPASYGKFRSYFRYIKNRGAIRNIITLTPPFFVVMYPYFLSFDNGFSLNLHETSMFYSCLLVLVYTLFRLTMFIPDFFSFTDVELKSANRLNAEREPSEDEKLKNEKEIEHLSTYLINRGIYELNHFQSRTFMDGELSAALIPSNNGIAHFNFFIKVNNTTPDELKEKIAHYGYKFADLLVSSKCDITQFVMSFHVTIFGDKQRNLFFRFDHNEFGSLKLKYNSDPMCIYHLQNICLNELFR